MRNKLKFKQLLNQFRSLRFEEKYMEDVLLEAHEDFEECFQKFIKEHEIDVESLESKNKSRVERIIEQNLEDDPKEDSKDLGRFKKTYRKIAKMIHPDRLADDDPRRKEYEDDFRKVNSAIENGVWSDFFDVVDKYNLDVEEFDEANRLIMEDIEKVSNQIKGKKTTFSWLLSQCNDEKCREDVIRTFLRFMYDHKEE